MSFVPELPPLAKIAKEAGDVIAKMQEAITRNYDNGNGPQAECDGEGNKWHQKPDESVVTDADIKANQMICKALAEQFPAVAVVSEENSEAQNQLALKARDRFETDPLDNTGGFVGGKDGFSVNIGRIVDGVPTEGVIYFPAKKELYFTGKDKKAYVQIGDAPPKPIQVHQGVREILNVAVGRNEQNLEHLAGKPINMVERFAQQRTCSIARGECDISGINKGDGGFNTWDIAGPHAVLLAAGGDIVTEKGVPLRYNNESVKVPNHIAGSVEALQRCIPGYVPVREDRVRT